MQKIPTLFVRDDSKPGHPVTDEWKPECLWVRDGEGVATVKFDGMNVKIDGGCLYKRQKPKDRDYDAASYVQCEMGNPADRWAFEAFERAHAGGLNVAVVPQDGIYELVGPKIQGDPQDFRVHTLIRVVPPSERVLAIAHEEIARTFDGLCAFLERPPYIEGVVFHHPDGRMAKIKRRDYGLRWPA